MHSLSSRLLLLTVVFVMLSEVLVFMPSIASFRKTWLMEKMGEAHLAIMALDATPDGMVSDKLRHELLTNVGAIAIILQRRGARLVLSEDMPRDYVAEYDLAEAGPLTLIRDALNTLLMAGNRIIRVSGPSPKSETVIVEVVVDEWPLHVALVDFAWRIFFLSLLISLVTAAMVFLALQWMIVRPMRHLSASMVAFRENPEDATRVIVPTERRDEIGIARRELAGLQSGLLAALKQKEHLAALGIAVAKINHDLRGILSSALLVSDRLADSDDPEVRRTSPTLVASIERAIALCRETLNFVGETVANVAVSRFPLASLIDDAGMGLPALVHGGVTVMNRVPPDFVLEADRDQLFRLFGNLMRNAAEAGARVIRVEACRDNGRIEIDIGDDGPGMPPRARDKLFLPFQGSGRAGGTGLGLVIARDIAVAHGGDLTLLRTDAEGTVFRLVLPMNGATG